MKPSTAIRIKQNKRMMLVALSKMRRFNKREYSGALTPVECMCLLLNGARTNARQHLYSYEYIAERIDKGICNQNWFYCELTDEQKDTFDRMKARRDQVQTG